MISYGDFTRTVDVEQDLPRRILGWTTSDGEVVELVRTERMAYWQMNGPEDTAERAKLGLEEEVYGLPVGR